MEIETISPENLVSESFDYGFPIAMLVIEDGIAAQTIFVSDLEEAKNLANRFSEDENSYIFLLDRSSEDGYGGLLFEQKQKEKKQRVVVPQVKKKARRPPNGESLNWKRGWVR
jgi:hypothetical protein